MDLFLVTGSMAARLAGASTPLITLLDAFDPKIPAVCFGIIALLSGFWVCFLPETMNQPMPESIQGTIQINTFFYSYAMHAYSFNIKTLFLFKYSSFFRWRNIW